MTSMALVLAFASVAAPPVAVPGPPALAYAAPAACPGEAAFVAAVAARVGSEPPLAARADAKDAARLLMVTIRDRGDGFDGTFSVRDGRGPTATRSVHGRACGEVADALAVMTAIELDPAAASGAPAPSAAPAAEPAAAGDGAAPAPPARADPAPRPEPTVSQAARPEPGTRLRAATRPFPARTETVHVPAGELRFDIARQLDLAAGATAGLLPGVLMPRFELQSTIAHFVTTPDGAQRIAGVVLQVDVAFLSRTAYATADTRTTAVGVDFGVGICQSPLYDSKGWVLIGCGELGGGSLQLDTTQATGTGAPMTISKQAGFGRAGLALEAAYHLGAGFEIDARLAGGLTIGRVTAERQDGSQIFKSSFGYASGALGLGYRF